MAIGAITKTPADSGSVGPGHVYADAISFAGDGAYPTGGTAFDALFKAVVKDDRNILAVLNADSGGFTPVYDKATGKLKVYRTGAVNAAQEEVPNTTNLSATTFRLVVISV